MKCFGFFGLSNSLCLSRMENCIYYITVVKSLRNKYLKKINTFDKKMVINASSYCIHE